MSDAIPNSILDFVRADRRRDGLWATKLAYYLMWFEYLAISPSYEIARRIRSDTLRDIDRERMPADIDDVLAVYDDLHDVQRTLFPVWWRKYGLSHFGYEGSPPRVTKVGDLFHDKINGVEPRRMRRFIENGWVDQGKQRSVLVAIPTGLPTGRITRQVNAILNKLDESERMLQPPRAKYPLLGQRHHKETMFRYLGAIWLRTAAPRWALWRVGARSGVSDTYSPELDPKAKVVSGQQVYDREMLTILTSRALLRGRMIAENAARGRFPSYVPCVDAMLFDYPPLYKQISSRKRWQKAEKKRLAPGRS
ncbi:MAG: hypothetical protein Rhims3KO_18210 [Hyphomicrobiales bacterium]